MGYFLDQTAWCLTIKRLNRKKLAARNKQKNDFKYALILQLIKLMQDDEMRKDFTMEMSRFIPQKIKERTLDSPEYWAYVQTEVNAIAHVLIDNNALKNPFDMG